MPGKDWEIALQVWEFFAEVGEIYNCLYIYNMLVLKN